MCTLRLLGIQFFFEQLLKRKGKNHIIMSHNYVRHSSTRSSFSSTQRLSFHTIQVSLKMCNDNSGLFENAQPQFGSLWNVQQWFGYPWKCATTILGIFEMAERNYHSPQDQKQNQIVHSTLIPLLQILTVCEKQQEMEHRCLTYS
jgi:hypothetical protein